MKSILRVVVAVFTLCFCVSLLAGPSGDNLENPNWDAKKIPAPTEPPIKPSAMQEWTAAEHVPPTQTCQTQDIWKVLKTSKISTVVMKEIKVPVKAGFDRFMGNFFVDKKTNELQGGQGSLDLSSFDSLNDARDHRVQRYVFNVEKPGMDVATVSFSFNKGLAVPRTGTSTGEVDADIVMGGTHYRANFPVKLARVTEKSIQLTTLQDASFTYVTDEMKPRIQEMMKACNHHFISSWVQVGMNLMLENTCAK